MKMAELQEKLLEKTDNVIKINQLNGKPNKQLNDNDLYRIIKESCDIIIIDYSEEQDLTNYTYAIYNPRTDTYVRDREYLGSLVQFIINNQQVSPNISSKNAVNNIAESIKFSKDDNDLTKANIPPEYLVKFTNCIYDLKNDIKYEFNDDEIKDYHFINKIRYPLVPLEDTDEAMLSIVKKVFKTWSKNDIEVEKLMKQMIYSYIEGNGRGIQIILNSEGGDGKSTFLRMIQKLGHSTLTHHMNLDGYGDDNQLNQIDPSTKLILGDDLQSNFKVSNKGLSQFKTLIDGGSINVSEKFMPNKLIKSNALKIQATNTDVKFFENNDAIRDRVLLLQWPHYNFRQNPVEDFDLDQLTGKRGQADKDFMIALLSYVVNTTEYFNKFSITDKMKADFNEILDSNDMLLQQLRDLEEIGLFNHSHIPSIFLYEHYKYWLKQNNPGSQPMKQIEYSRQIKKKLIDFGYTESKRQKVKYIKKDQFNFSQYNEFNLNIDTESLNKTTMFINPNLDIEEIMIDIINDCAELNFDNFKSTYNENILKNYLYYLVRNEPTTVIDILNLCDTNYKIHEIDEMNYDELVNCLMKYYQSEVNHNEAE